MARSLAPAALLLAVPPVAPLAAALAAAFLLAACGGGGGGAEQPIALTFTPGTLTGTAFQGQGNVALGTDVKYRLTARLSQVPTTTTYVQVLIAGQGFLPGAIPVGDNGDGSFSASLPADTSLEPGTYAGTITVTLCHDAACRQPYALTGNSLAYSVRVTPRLQVEMLHDGVLFATVGANARSCIAGPVNTGSISPVEPRYVTGSVLGVSSNLPVTFEGMEGVVAPPGPAITSTSWAGAMQVSQPWRPCLTITATDGSGQQVTLAPLLVLPRLVPEVTTVDLVAAVGQGALAPVELSLGTESGEPVAYTTVVESPLGGVTLEVASTGAAPGTLRVTPRVYGYAYAWTYSPALHLWPDNGEARSTVLFRVKVVEPAAVPSSVRFDLTATSPPGALTQHVAFGDLGGARSFTASSDRPWLSAAPATGTSDGGATLTLEPAALAALPAGLRTATVHLLFDMGGGATAPLDLPVTLDLQVPRTERALPRASVAGLGGDVLVYGSGFPAGFTGPVLVGGEPATSVRRLSSTTLRITPSTALAAGAHPVRIENAAGLDRSAAALVVVPAAPSRAAAAPASTGAKVGLAFDEVGRVLYVANATAGRLERYREAAGWERAADGSDELVLQGVKSLALSPDGATLVAVAGGAFRLVDTATFALRPQQPTAAAPDSAKVSLEITAAGLAFTLGYDAVAQPVVVLDLGTLTTRELNSASYGGLAGAPDGSMIGVFSWAGTLALWSAGAEYRSTSAFWDALVGTFDRNGDRLLLHGNSGWVGSTFYTGRISRLFDTSSWTSLPGTVAPEYDPPGPPGAPPGTQAVILSPLGRARVYAWDGVAVRCYDLLGTLDASTVYPVLWSKAAAPGANARLAISADERTAFLAGDEAVVVLPLPE